MTPTEELRHRLRWMLDEKIPAGGHDADTRFLNEEVDELLREAGSAYEAAAVGWTLKAGMYQREMSGIEETATGEERYRLTSLKERMDYALAMAETYSKLASRRTSTGSLIVKIKKPEVI